MKKELMLTLCFLSTLQVLAQTTYNAGNALTLDSATFNLGGIATQNTLIKGKYSSNLYNFSLDTFNLLSFMGKRVDIEGTDSVRLASGKLIKLISLGDIQIGTTNSLALDGNLWFKRYKKTPNNSGILTVDTCGRVSVSNSITLTDYFKQGGNSFGQSAYLGTNDENELNLLTNGQSKLTLSPYNVHSMYGSLIVSGWSTGSDPYIALRNQYGHTLNYINSGGFRSGRFLFGSGGEGIYSYANTTTGPNTSFVDINIGGEGISSTGGDFTLVRVGKTFHGGGRKGDFTALLVNPGFTFDVNDTGTYAGIKIEPELYGANNEPRKNFRSLEVVYGNTLLNTRTGSTGIGHLSSIDKSAILELQGYNAFDDSKKGFLPPRLSKYYISQINDPATSLLVYNSDSNWFQIKKPDGWYKFITEPIEDTSAYARTPVLVTTNETNNKSFVTKIGDGKNITFNIQHNLNSEFIMVQFIDCGAEANCNLLLSIPDNARIELNGKNEAVITFKEVPAYNRYKVMFLKIQ